MPLLNSFHGTRLQVSYINERFQLAYIVQYRLKNAMQPSIPQKKPIVEKVSPGTYWWCSCGKSDSQPFCDGSHAGTEFTPVEIVIDDEKNVAWCACKHSKCGAFCDGSHSAL